MNFGMRTRSDLVRYAERGLNGSKYRDSAIVFAISLAVIVCFLLVSFVEQVLN